MSIGLDRFEIWFNTLKSQKPDLTKQEFLQICEEELARKFEATRKSLFSSVTMEDLVSVMNAVKKVDNEVPKKEKNKKAIIRSIKK